jgi:serine/threonine-protein kinase
MHWKKHIDIATAAMTRGWLDERGFAEAMIALARDDAAPPEKIWLAPGLLRSEQLERLLNLVQASSSSVMDEGMGSAGGDGIHKGKTARPGAAPKPGNENPSVLNDRYALLSPLGSGGIGEVLECLDVRIGRRVALKALRRDLCNNPAVARMLEREARVTGALEHPSIIPVYDMGEQSGIGPYYVMRLAGQASLYSVLQRLATGDPLAVRDYGLGRLLRSYIQVCQAVDYAHSCGVIHCDIKPENILLGNFGEVLVVDWGSAFRMDEGAQCREGTPGFMAPEQLDPVTSAIDARTDVFALGAVLYEVLCLEPAFPAARWTAMQKAAANREVPYSPPIPPRQRTPHRDIPEELEEICMQALELEPGRRVPSARALASAVEAFLEGTREKERRLARAGELAQNGDQMAANYQEFIETRPERVTELETLRATIAPWEGPERKRVLWDAEERLAVVDSLGVRTLQAAVSAYEQALDEVPGHIPSRRGLARLYWTELERALDRRDEFDRLYFEELVKQYDDGTIAREMRREGLLKVTIRPPEAMVMLHSLMERDRRLVVSKAQRISEETTLAPGSYVVVVSGGGRTVHYPLLMRAGRDHRGVIDLEEAADLRPGEILVPGGPALLGGDSTNIGSRGLRAVEVPSFIIGERPVSMGEFLEFLRELYRRDGSAAEDYLPRSSDGSPYWRWTEDTFVPANVADLVDDRRVQIELPVFGVTALAAEAYAAWWSARTGFNYRLPTEDEWEKAARGTDGRSYPWGDYFDAAYCKMRQSRQGRPRPEPSGSFPVDVSPYGVRDMAGGIADWAVPPTDREQRGDGRERQLVSRGGAWCDWQVDCSLGARRTYFAAERSARVGFRLVRSPGARKRSGRPDDR